MRWPRVAFALILAGCVGIPVRPDDTPIEGDGGSGSIDSGSPTPFQIELAVSNSTPNEGEEIVLECHVSPTSSTNLTYGFDPDDRLFVDHRDGRATFIVQSSDIGTTLSFLCSATDGDAITVRSQVRIILPSR